MKCGKARADPLGQWARAPKLRQEAALTRNIVHDQPIAHPRLEVPRLGSRYREIASDIGVRAVDGERWAARRPITPLDNRMPNT
jgi:hypothetical protein